MDPTALDIASFWLNGALLTSAGAVCAYLGMSACFPKRNGTWLFWAYFILKAIVMSWFDTDATLLGSSPDAFRVGVTITFAVLSYFVLYYTWDAEVLKIGLAGMVVDLLAACAILSALLVVDTSLNGNPTLDYLGPLGPRTVLLALLYPTVFWLLARLLAPLARWVRTYEFRHRKAWQALVVSMITFTSAGRFQGAEDVATGLIALAIAIPIVAGCMAAYLSARIRAQRAKRRALQAADDMMRAYSLAVMDQGAVLERNRDALDALAGRMERLGDGDDRPELLQALHRLQRECDRIRYGIHSDCPALDAVLAHHLPNLTARGLQPNVAVSPLGDGHTALAQAIDRLLNWTEESLGHAGSGNGVNCGNGGALELFIARRGNLCVADLRLPLARNANFPRRILEDVAPEGGLTVLDAYGNGVKTVRFMFEEV